MSDNDMSHNAPNSNLRAAVETLAEKWKHPGLLDDPDENPYDDLRDLLDAHPEPLSGVTEDELADALRESVDNTGIRGRLYHEDAAHLARAILNTFHVTPKEES